MGIQQLRDVYNPLAKKEEKPKPWKEYVSISKLNEFIKANKTAGFSIGLTNGEPALRFNPGLKKDDPRWELATQAENLLFAAADDLRYCAEHGLLDLPVVNRIYNEKI